MTATTVLLTAKQARITVTSDDMAVAKQKRQQLAKTRDVAGSSAASDSASPQKRLTLAHAKFTQTKKGTPQHDKAWEELVDALFVNAK